MTRLRSRSSYAWFLLLTGLPTVSFSATSVDGQSSAPVVLAHWCNPLEPVLGGLRNGGFAAAWTTGFNATDPGVRVRLWDRRGAAMAPEHFAPSSRGVPRPPALAVSPSGAFAVVWTEREQIRLWRFDERGREQGLPLSIGGPVPESTAPTQRVVGVTADGEDGFAVVWFSTGLHIARIDAHGRITRVEAPTPEDFGDAGLQRFAVALHPEGDLLLLQQVDPPNISPPRSFLTAYRIPLDDPESSETFFERDAFRYRGAALAVDDRGRIAVGWNNGAEVAYQRFDRELQPLADPVAVVTEPQHPLLWDLGLAADGEGNLALAWSRPQPFESNGVFRIFVQGFSAAADAFGPPRDFGFEGRFLEDARRPSLVVTGPAEVTVSWSLEINSLPLAPSPCGPGWTLLAQPFEIAADQALLLVGGRFRVEVEWQVRPPGASSGRGHALAGNDDTGRFWFFDPANVELVTKVIDGREVNGHFWFFYGALSNVGYRITVTNQRTGLSKTYNNPPGRLASFADTLAFPAP